MDTIEIVLKTVFRQKTYFRKELNHVIRTQRKRSRSRRVRNHSRAGRHRRDRRYALARTQDR